MGKRKLSDNCWAISPIEWVRTCETEFTCNQGGCAADPLGEAETVRHSLCPWAPLLRETHLGDLVTGMVAFHPRLCWLETLNPWHSHLHLCTTLEKDPQSLGSHNVRQGGPTFLDKSPPPKLYSASQNVRVTPAKSSIFGAILTSFTPLSISQGFRQDQGSILGQACSCSMYCTPSLCRCRAIQRSLGSDFASFSNTFGNIGVSLEQILGQIWF